MKKVFASLFLMIGSIVLLNSCSKDTYYDFDQDDEKWLVYAEGRVIKFQDSTGAIATYYVSEKSRGYKVDGSTYYQHANITVLKKDDSLSVSLAGGIYAIRKENGPEVTIAWPHHPIQLNPLAQPPSILTVKGIAYSDVYVSEANPLFMDAQHNIIRFYYSKSAGFIRFDVYNGNSFELIN